MMKKNKLTIEKFRILELTSSSSIKVKGGTYTTIISDDQYTTAFNSENTTFTTDPNEPCPETILSNTDPYTNDTTAGNNSVPTFGSNIEP